MRLEFPSRWIVMMRRTIPAFAALIALSQPASAGVPLFGHVSCAVVRFYVAKYSEAAAEKWARSHGASEAEIETARHCLHGTDVQTATLAPKPQVIASVAGHEGSQHKPDEREPSQAVLYAAVEGQRAIPEQNGRDEQSGIHEVIRPKDIEDPSTGHESNGIKDQPVATDGKANTLRPRNLGGTHRASSSGATGWFKRLWSRLTRGPRLTLAVLHFNGARR